MEYKTKISRNIEEVDTRVWDNIADFCFMKSDVLRIIEKLELGKDAYYLQIYDNEKLAAIAVFYGQNNRTLYQTIEETLYGNYYKLVKPLLGLNPSLVCYFPYSPFYEMYKIAQNYDKKELFEIISNELKALAKSQKYKSYAILSVADENLAKETKTMIPVFSGFKTGFKISGNSFEEYISKIEKKSHRSTMRKDRRLFEQCPYSIEKIKKLNGYKEEVINIFNDNFEKYGQNKHERELTKEFIEQLDKESERLTFFIGKFKDEVISAMMILEDDSRVVGIRVGQVQKKDSNDNHGFPFYNIVIYEPMIYAIEKSKKYFELGTGSYKYKTRRGAELVDCYNMINSTNRLKNSYLRLVMRVLDRRNKQKHLNRLDAQEG
jgi:predicted N-acyltransferase